jgi:hypothetical protein
MTSYGDMTNQSYSTRRDLKIFSLNFFQFKLGSQVITTRFTKANTKAKKHHLVISNFGV